MYGRASLYFYDRSYLVLSIAYFELLISSKADLIVSYRDQLNEVKYWCYVNKLNKVHLEQRFAKLMSSFESLHEASITNYDSNSIKWNELVSKMKTLSAENDSNDQEVTKIWKKIKEFKNSQKSRTLINDRISNINSHLKSLAEKVEWMQIIDKIEKTNDNNKGKVNYLSI